MVKKVKPDPFDRFFNYSWIVVFLLPFLLYLSSLNLGYVYFDDDVLVLENQAKLSDPSNLGKLFTTDVFLGQTVPYYRPMLNVALMIGAQLGGTDPKAYHFISVIIHCLSCVSLLWLLSLLGFSKPKSLIGALLFSLHPLIANAVFWIPAINDLLITLFGLLSFACFIKFAQDKSLKFFFLHLFFFTAAFFSKESAIALPLLFLFYLIISKIRIIDPAKITMYLSWIAIIFLWFFMRQSSTGTLQGDEQGLGAIMKNLPFLPEIVARFFLPFDLAVMPVFSFFYTLAGVIIMLLLILVIFISKTKNTSLVMLGLIWFLVFAIPNMFIRLFNTNDSFDYLEHRAVLPSIGLLLLLLAILPEAWVDLRKKQIQIFYAALMIIFIFFTFLQERKYKDGEAFWGSVLKVSPDRAWFHHFYGRYYFKQQDFVKFEEQLHEAVKLKEYGAFYYNLGMIELMQKRNLEQAFTYFTKAIEKGETKPDVMKNFVNLCIESAIAITKTGDYAKASERVEIALQYEPANPIALMNLALFSINLGNSQKAVALWRHVIQIDPSVISAYKNLFLYYRNNTNRNDSAGYFESQYLKYGGKIEDLVGQGK
ncbi:MAG: glycosyltransferase family 39 protein [Bacteroidota bacterium]